MAVNICSKAPKETNSVFRGLLQLNYWRNIVINMHQKQGQPQFTWRIFTISKWSESLLNFLLDTLCQEFTLGIVLLYLHDT